MQNTPETCPASTIAIGMIGRCLDRVTQKFFFCIVFVVVVVFVFLFHQNFKIIIPWRNAQV